MSQNIEAMHFDERMLGDGIDFVGLITKNGRLVDCNNKNSLNLSKEQKEMFFMSCSLQQKMNQDYDDDLGQVRYSVTERENTRIIIVPQESDTLIFVMDNGGEFLSCVKRVLDAIRHARSLKQGPKRYDMT
ncbi:hypothetical protein [Candidatus Nitrosotalea bavarica]|uniref:hypothetical protein n=1 Tax=Candidatus Nitrosotalea bavarica TaxID=1903277 RepID=UPI001055E0E4|nr:hypothetical protein [Candidatus Nitrosotalea bavarica]